MKQFVSITDELIFDHPELIHSPLVPFSHDYECYHWLDGEGLDENLDKDNSDDED